jgi:diguanylate cyclase (GGDEF)-like protein/PAS domain S-box-containing protein
MSDRDRPGPLEARLHQLETLLDHVGAYVFTKDLEGRYTYVNRLGCELLDRPPEEILGRHDDEFFASGSAEQVVANDRAVIEQGVTVEREEILQTGSGAGPRRYWVVKMPLRDERGAVIGLCGISTDVTEHRRLERQLVQRQRLLDTVLDNIGSYVYMKACDGRYLYVNRNAAEFFGLPPEQVIGKTDRELISPENAASFEVLDESALRGSDRVAGVEEVVDADGRTRHHWSVKVPLIQNGQVISTIGISSDITEVVELRQKYEELAHTDSLTSLSNRRHVLEQLNRELRRMQRHGHPLALIMFDIDRFKAVNDGFGHAAGDRVLIEVAEICRSTLRDIDIPGRFGGDEFLIILPETGSEQADAVARRLQRRIHDSGLHTEDGRSIRFTTSMGVVVAENGESLDRLLGRADEALYQAKQHGRDRIWTLSGAPC